jgi:hypothetical protein
MHDPHFVYRRDRLVARRIERRSLHLTFDSQCKSWCVGTISRFYLSRNDKPGERRSGQGTSREIDEEQHDYCENAPISPHDSWCSNGF